MNKRKRTKSKIAAQFTDDKNEGKLNEKKTTQSSDRTTDELQETGHSPLNVTKQNKDEKKKSDNVQTAGQSSHENEMEIDRFVDKVQAAGHSSQESKMDSDKFVDKVEAEGHSSQESKMDSERTFDSFRAPDQSSESSEYTHDDKAFIKIIEQSARQDESNLRMMLSEEATRKSISREYVSKLKALVDHHEYLTNIMAIRDPRLAENMSLKLEPERLQLLRDLISSEIEMHTNIAKVEPDEEISVSTILEANANEQTTTSTSELKDEPVIDLEREEEKKYTVVSHVSAHKIPVESELKLLKQKRYHSKSEETATPTVKDEITAETQEAREAAVEAHKLIGELIERIRAELEKSKTCCDMSSDDIKEARDVPQNMTEGKKKVGKGRKDRNKSTANFQAFEEGLLNMELVFDEDTTEILHQLEERIEKEKSILKVKDSNTTEKSASPDETKNKMLHDECRHDMKRFLMFQESKLDEQMKLSRVVESEVEILGERRNLLSSEEKTIADVSKAEEQGVKTETEAREERSIKAENEYDEEQRLTAGDHEQDISKKAEPHKEQDATAEDHEQDISKKAEPHKEQDATAENETIEDERAADRVWWLNEQIIPFRNTDVIRFEIENNGNKHVFVGRNLHFFSHGLKEVRTFVAEDGAVKVSFIGKQIIVSTHDSEFNISVQNPNPVASADDATQTDV